MSKRQTHGGRPVGRMDGSGSPGRYVVVGPRAGFTQERGGADEDWRHFAECTYEDPELFFPIGNTGPALLQIEDAKAVCRRCPVIESCFNWAISTGQDHGVAGGMSEDERRSFKRRVARGKTGAARRYTDEQRAEVLAAFEAERPKHENAARAAYAVGKRFGVDQKTVLRWLEEGNGGEGPCGPRETPGGPVGAGSAARPAGGLALAAVAPSGSQGGAA